MPAFTRIIRLLLPFLSLLIAVVDLRAGTPEQTLRKHTKMIQYAAKNFYFMLHTFKWNQALLRAKGIEIDEIAYATVRDVAMTVPKIEGEFFKKFKFISNPEFTSMDANPDRLAINDMNGTIYWNAEKLSKMKDLQMLDIVRILFHEMGHHVRTVYEADGYQRRGRISTADEFLESELYGGGRTRYWHKVDTARRDRIGEVVIEFLESRMKTATDADGKMTFSYMNLLLDSNRNTHRIVFLEDEVKRVLRRSQLFWLTSDCCFYQDATNSKPLMELLVDTSIRIKRHSALESMDDQLEAHLNPIVPLIEIERLSTTPTGQLMIVFQHRNAISTPKAWNDKWANQLAFENPVEYAQLSSRRIALIDIGLPTDETIRFPTTVLDFNVRKSYLETEFALKQIINKPNDTFVTLEFDKIPDGATYAVLVCRTESGEKVTFNSKKIVSKKDRKSKTVVFRTNHRETLTVIEVLFPTSNRITNFQEYVEFSVRPSENLKIPATQFENSAQRSIVNASDFEIGKGGVAKVKLRIDRFRYAIDSQQMTELEQTDISIKNTIENLVFEITLAVSLSHRSGQFLIEWNEPIVERVRLSKQEILKYAKRESFDGIEIEIPYEVFAAVVKKHLDSLKLKPTDEFVAISIQKIWSRTIHGDTEALKDRSNSESTSQIKIPVSMIRGVWPRRIPETEVIQCVHLFK